MKVSAIVPVYNPGSNIDDCIDSLLNQSLPADEYEAIFVDDGSTDATPARLDELARRHPNVRVEHIPNSGWPGRPRNVGVEMARGEYVYFIDNDDWVGPEALERLYATAQRDAADVVIGKVVAHGGRRTSRPMFRRNRSGLGIDRPLLLTMLTPHKLFRRAFLQEHAIRFPEGRVRLEDHIFVLHAYLHTDRVSILADYPCYHWILRDPDVNASSGQIEPVGYYQNLRDVLDLLDEHLEPGPLRDRLYAHWYRTKLLSRVGHPGLTRRDAEYGEALYTEIRRLAQERFDERMEKHLSFPMRLRAALLRDDRYDALEQLARLEGGLRARVRLLDVEVGPRRLKLRLRGAMAGRTEPLEWERHGEQLRLRPGGVLAQVLPAERLDATRPLGNSKIDVMLRSADRGEFVVPVKAELELRRDGVESEGDGEIEPVLVGRATINARRAAAGRPLDAGDWELFARVTLAGFQAETPIRQHTTRVPIVMRVDERARIRLVGVQRTGLGRRLVRPLGRVKGFVRRRARARSPRRR